MLRAYKTRLYLNNRERTWCKQCAGAARWCYNWGLDAMIVAYKSGRKTSMFSERRRLNAEKDVIAPWLRQVPFEVLGGAFYNLGRAYENFFRRVKQGAKEKGFPKFKSRKNPTQSFTLRGSIRATETKVKLPRIGWLRLAEHGYLPTAKRAHILFATLSSQDHGLTWHISLQVDETLPEPEAPVGPVMGLDVGIHHLIATSDGMIYDNPRAMENAQRKVNCLSREMARRKKGGANWHKTVSKLNRAHAKVRNVRAYVLHNVSSQIIARKPRAIVIEDLNVKGMLANHHLARAISDVAFGELRRQLEYKAAWAGVGVVVADQWYPSSKTCSECGHVRDTLTLAEREYVCPACGMVLDRDINAARNLAALAV